jgi:hypothetical protein
MPFMFHVSTLMLSCAALPLLLLFLLVLLLLLLAPTAGPR